MSKLTQTQTDINVKPKMITFLEENKKDNFCNLESGNNFLNMTPKVQSIKEQTERQVFIKI